MLRYFHDDVMFVVIKKRQARKLV